MDAAPFTDATPSEDGGGADAAPWVSWDGVYALTWTRTSNTCGATSTGYAPGWDHVDLEGLSAEPPPAMNGTAHYTRVGVPSCCAWAEARVTSSTTAVIDSVEMPDGTVSLCQAMQVGETAFECEMTRHVASGDPAGPCDVTWRVHAERP